MAGEGSPEGGGYAGSFGVGVSNNQQSVQMPKGRNNVIYSANQKVDKTDSITVYSTGASYAKGQSVAPRSFYFKNTGNAGLGISIKVPHYDTDPVVGTSIYLQFFLGKNEEITLESSKLISAANTGFNTGTEIAEFSAPGDFRQDSGTNLDHATASSMGSDTSVETLYLTTVTDAANCDINRFRAGDLIRVDSEIMEVVGKGTGADLANNYLTVRRGVYGSTAATHGDDSDVYFAYFNTDSIYSTYSTVHTNNSGHYTSTNFFGLGRASTIAASGIMPGSTAFIFYTEPYQEMGVSGASTNTNSGLTSGSTYYINVAVNGGATFEVGFTVDSTSLGGSTGILKKIQTILDAEYYKTGSALNGKRISVGMYDGDIRWTFHERKQGSSIALTAGTSGADTTTELLAQAIGIFPASALPAITTKLPPESISMPGTSESVPNTTDIMYDNSFGQLIAPYGSGSIDYDTGAIRINAYPNAEFQYVACHSSGLAGRASSSKSNIIEEIYARSTNTKVNSKVYIEVRG